MTGKLLYFLKLYDSLKLDMSVLYDKNNSQNLAL